MSRTDDALNSMFAWHSQHFGTFEQQETAKRLAQEKARADAEMAERYANLHMPEDIRSRAKSWGMENWAEVLWSRAFQAGYREAIRDRAATPTAVDGENSGETVGKGGAA